jgi:DNA-binding MarR family transcriptional regulator
LICQIGFDSILYGMGKEIGAVGQWLERLSSMHRNLMRKFAADEELQLVHVEILQYLSVCNRYSDTTQAISEYLGQTKGSISQSLAHLEENGFVKRSQDKNDRRIFHLALLPSGHSVAKRLAANIKLDGTDQLEPALMELLRSIQKRNGLKGFGVCHSCQFNQNPGKNQFVCGLTNEKLSLEDIKKICKEHEAT